MSERVAPDGSSTRRAHTPVSHSETEASSEAPTIDGADVERFSAANAPSGPRQRGWRARASRVDQYQRSHTWLAFPIAVGRKFGQDGAGYLAALVAYYGFFSVFPLMLVFTSLIGFFVTDEETQKQFVDVAASQIPVIGPTLANNSTFLDGSLVGVVVGSLIALWSGLKIVNAMQHALNGVWNIAPVEQPNAVIMRLRSILMLLVVAGGLAGSVALSGVAASIEDELGNSRWALWSGGLVVSIGVYVVAFQLLTDRRIPWRYLVPGAAFGGTAWWAIQTFGASWVSSQQERAGATYGQFASVIALMTFLYVSAQLSIVGAEISAVWERRLWPRSLGSDDLTDADVRSFELLADGTRQRDDYDIVLIRDGREAHLAGRGQDQTGS